MVSFLLLCSLLYASVHPPPSLRSCFRVLHGRHQVHSGRSRVGHFDVAGVSGVMRLSLVRVSSCLTRVIRPLDGGADSGCSILPLRSVVGWSGRVAGLRSGLLVLRGWLFVLWLGSFVLWSRCRLVLRSGSGVRGWGRLVLLRRRLVCLGLV